MAKWIIGVATVLGLFLLTIEMSHGADRLTPEAAAEKLEPSIGKLRQGSREICTVWKMGDLEWATAWHCVALTGKDYRIRTNPFGDRDLGVTLEPKSILMPLEKAEKKDHWEDWAIINVRDTSDEIPALAIDCRYEIKLGETVAYMGFPIQPGGPAQIFSTGIVTQITPNRKRPYHFAADLVGGPGASGSPVISLKTGNVIGFVTRGIPTRGSLLSVGIESVAGMDLCDDAPANGISDPDGSF